MHLRSIAFDFIDFYSFDSSVGLGELRDPITVEKLQYFGKKTHIKGFVLTDCTAPILMQYWLTINNERAGFLFPFVRGSVWVKARTIQIPWAVGVDLLDFDLLLYGGSVFQDMQNFSS